MNKGQTFGDLWKSNGGIFDFGKTDPSHPRMNTAPLPQTAPLVGTPRNASGDLLRQARQAILKSQNRKKVSGELARSTARKPAAVVAPPAPPRAPGFGGAGYSGNNAAQLGHDSNPGFVTATPPKPPRPDGL